MKKNASEIQRIVVNKCFTPKSIEFLNDFNNKKAKVKEELKTLEEKKVKIVNSIDENKKTLKIGSKEAKEYISNSELVIKSIDIINSNLNKLLNLYKKIENCFVIIYEKIELRLDNYDTEEDIKKLLEKINEAVELKKNISLDNKKEYIVIEHFLEQKFKNKSNEQQIENKYEETKENKKENEISDDTQIKTEIRNEEKKENENNIRIDENTEEIENKTEKEETPKITEANAITESEAVEEVDSFYNLTIDNLKDNLVLKICEKRVELPYTKKEISDYLSTYPKEYKTVQDVVSSEYMFNIDLYNKHPALSRFKEAYYLCRTKEMMSIWESFNYARGYMFRSDLNSYIIAAAKSIKQLEDYIYCLDNNKLNEFKHFKIVFSVNPLTI